MTIDLERNELFALTQLQNSPNFQLLKQLIERDKIKSIETRLNGDSGKPLIDIAEVRELQGERRGLKAVFAYLDFVVKQSNKKEKERI